MSDHVREQHSVLAAAEKRLLITIARRLPAAITSDHLTLLAFASMCLAGVGYGMAYDHRGWLWVPVGALAMNWFGDSLDGTLARVRRLERPRFGFYVDHVVDIVGITALMGGLAVSGFMSPVVALAWLVAYLLVSGEVFLATSVHSVFRMSFAGVGPTELRILLAAGTLALWNDPHVPVPWLGQVPLFDFGGVVAIIGLAVALSVSVSRNIAALGRLEPSAAARPTRRQPKPAATPRMA